MGRLFSFWGVAPQVEGPRSVSSASTLISLSPANTESGKVWELSDFGCSFLLFSPLSLLLSRSGGEEGEEGYYAATDSMGQPVGFA